MSLLLNPNLDVAQLASDFKVKKRIRINDVFELGSAEAILNCLKNYTAWELSYTDENSKPMRISNQALEKMSADDMQQIATGVHTRAANSYQYIYNFFPMVDAITTGKINEKSMLHEIATFLNGAKFMQFARDLTGNSSLVKIDPQANLYEPGNFKNLHDDMHDDKNARDRSIRRYAVVLGFTKNWSVNWGGNMNFYAGPNPTTGETCYPGFNTLTVFEVPALHSVSMVTPAATKARYTITGWLRDDPNITRLDLGDAAPENLDTSTEYTD